MLHSRVKNIRIFYRTEELMCIQSNLVVKRAKPLFFYENVLLYSKKNRVFSIDANGKETTLLKFNRSLLGNFLDSIKLAYRARRSGVWSSAVFENGFYFSFDRKLYCYDYLNKTLMVENTFEKGRGPLNYSIIDGIAGFDKCLVYGEYYGNADKKEISVFRKSHKSNWQKAYTFDVGLINHIHNFVPDIYNNCVWILAGDFNDSASIWKATENFSNVELIVSGEQIYRSCVAFPTANGLVYATDSQFIDNTVRILRNEGGLYVSEKIASINGPAIYGTDHSSYFVFSTSTEAELNFSEQRFKSLITSRRASRITKNQSDIVLVDKNTLECRVILSKEKDRWPFALFQFGVLMFPSGTDGTEKLYFYSIGSKKNDLCTEYLDLSSL